MGVDTGAHTPTPARRVLGLFDTREKETVFKPLLLRSGGLRISPYLIPSKRVNGAPKFPHKCLIN